MNENGSVDGWDDDWEDERPLTPPDDDCCGSSCNPCIFDVHKKLLAQWEMRRARASDKANTKKNCLNPLSYQTFVVKELVHVGKEFVRIQLDCSMQIDGDTRVLLNPGQHVILSVSNEKSRPYTPISWTDDSLELLVKIYPDGVLSSRLGHLRIDEEIRVRGPFGDFAYESNRWREIIGFCMGSGIAAIYPIARSIVNDENDETRFHLVAGFRRVDEIPLKNELRGLSDYWNVKCTFRISDEASDRTIVPPSGTVVERGRLNASAIHRILEDKDSPEETLVLVCGTREFNEILTRSVEESGFSNFHVFG